VEPRVVRPVFTMVAQMVGLTAALTVVPRVRPMVVPVARPVSTTAALMVVRMVEPMAVRTVELTAAPMVAQTGLLATDARA